MFSAEREIDRLTNKQRLKDQTQFVVVIRICKIEKDVGYNEHLVQRVCYGRIG